MSKQWSVRVPGNDGRVQVWAESAIAAAEMVAEQWCPDQDVSQDVFEVCEIKREAWVDEDNPVMVAFDDDGNGTIEGDEERGEGRI